MKRTFRALTTAVAVEIDDDLPARELGTMTIGAYPETTLEPELVFHLRRNGIACAGRYDDRVDDPDDVIPLFELDLYQELASRAAPGWLLHAAALERDGRAFVFAGPSGAGKTTLTLALMARGWRLITEEMVLIDRELAVYGLARPIHAPGSGPQRDALPTSWRTQDYPLRTNTGIVHNVIAQPPDAARVTTAVPLRALIRIDHAPAQTPSLVAMPPHKAIPRLWDCTLRRDQDGLDAAGTIIARSQPHELLSSTPAEALAQVVEIS